MITKILAAGVVALALLLGGCGKAVQINSGEVGKVLSSDGLEEDVRLPGTFRLPVCWFWQTCPDLVVLQVFENTVEVEGNYILPRSGNMDVSITAAVRYRVRPDPAAINEIFQRVRAETADGARLISSDQVYATYVRPVIADAIRTALGNYTIEEIFSNLTVVRDFVSTAVSEALADTPVEVTSFTFPRVEMPDIVVQAIRESESIEYERTRRLRQLAADLEIILQKRRLDLLQAQIDNEVDAIVSRYMGPRMATWRLFQIMQVAAENGTPITIHPSMFPQNTFDFANDDVDYRQVPTPDLGGIEDVELPALDAPVPEGASATR